MTLELNDPRLTAYALGELDDAERTEVETALTQSPVLAAEVEAIRAAAATLEAAFVAEPVLVLTDEQRNAIDPSRRREPAEFQSRDSHGAVSPSRDRKGAGATTRHEGTQARRHEGGVFSERGAEATRSFRPNFLRRYWVPTTLAASLTLAATVGYLSIPNLMGSGGPAREVIAQAKEAMDRRARESSDLSVQDAQPAFSMSPSGSNAAAPDFGQGVPQVDLQAARTTKVVAMERARQQAQQTTGDPNVQPLLAVTARRSPSPLQEQGGGGGGQGAFGGAGGAGGSWAQQLRFEQEPVGGVLQRVGPNQGFGSASRTRAVTAQPNENLELNYDFQSIRNISYGYQLPFGPQETLTGDAYAPVFDNPFHPVAHQPLSTFSIDVDTASYSNVRRMLNAGALPPRDAVRIEEIINYFDYDYPLPTDGRPFSVNVETSDCPWSPTHRLARIGIKGMEFTANQRPAANLVFLIDVSGSMQPANRLPLVQQSLRMLVGELRRDDQVAMVVYAGASGLVLPATKCGNRGAILEAIDRLQAGGSTNGGAGIQLAYKTAEANFIEGGVNRVILATDGDFNVGVTNGGELTTLVAEKAKGGVFLTVLGFGMGNLKDATLESLADKGNGNYAYIDTLAEAKKTLVDQIGGTLVTIAKDVKIQVEFNPAQVSSYRLIGYENRLLAARDFNDDTKDAGEIGAGHTVTAFYEIVPVGVAEPDDGVGPLKYQRGSSDGTTNENTESRKQKAESDEPTADSQESSDELMTVNLRYKEPDGDVSELIEVPVVDSGQTFADSSDDFAFALSAASLGMLLRGYPASENFDYDFVHELASGSMGDDASGYRAEFVELINRARALAAVRSDHKGGE